MASERIFIKRYIALNVYVLQDRNIYCLQAHVNGLRVKSAGCVLS